MAFFSWDLSGLSNVALVLMGLVGSIIGWAIARGWRAAKMENFEKAQEKMVESLTKVAEEFKHTAEKFSEEMQNIRVELAVLRTKLTILEKTKGCPFAATRNESDNQS